MKELKMSVPYYILDAIRNFAEEIGTEPLQTTADMLANHMFCESELIENPERYSKIFKCTDNNVDIITLVLPVSDAVWEALNDMACDRKEKPQILAVRLIAKELGYEETEESNEEDYRQLGFEHHEDILYELFGVTNDSDLDDAIDCFNQD